MRSLLALALAAAVGATPGAAPTTAVHTRDFSVEPTGQVQQFNVACEPGEELIGGGFSAASSALRVVGSFPSGGVWSVQAVNAGKVAAALQLEVNCVVDPPGKTTIVATKGVTPSAAAQCPDGTVLTGGGYLAGSGQRVSGAYVTGSHPMGDNGWGIDAAEIPGSAAQGTQEIEVFAVCLQGAQLASAQLALGKFPGEPVTGSCPTGETLSSLGYEVTDGTMQPYAVQKATTTLLAINADAPIAVRVTTLCLKWPEPSTTTASVNWPLIGGGGLLVLVALVLAYRMRTRRTKPGAGFDVVVRSEEGGFGLDQLREVP